MRARVTRATIINTYFNFILNKNEKKKREQPKIIPLGIGLIICREYVGIHKQTNHIHTYTHKKKKKIHIDVGF